LLGYKGVDDKLDLEVERNGVPHNRLGLEEGLRRKVYLHWLERI